MAPEAPEATGRSWSKNKNGEAWIWSEWKEKNRIDGEILTGNRVEITGKAKMDNKVVRARITIIEVFFLKDNIPSWIRNISLYYCLIGLAFREK